MSVGSLRRFSMFFFPLLTGVFGALGYFFDSVTWFDWVFKVALSGTVGIWTNHFAIRMLFKPHSRTVFGRQGLIPAKRAELASAIGTAVAQRLLDTDSVLAYMEEHGLPEKAARFVVDGVQGLAARQDVRTATADYLQGVLERLVEQHSGSVALRVEEYVSEFIAERTAPGKVWSALRAALRRELDNPGTRESVARTLIIVADRNDTLIAAFVNDALDDYIGSKKLPERLLLGFGKKVLRVNEEMIRREIRKKVGSPGFFDSLLSFLDEGAPEIEAWIDSPGMRDWFSRRLDEYREKAADWVRNEGMELAIRKARLFLSSDALWDWVMAQIDTQVLHLAAMARERINSPGFRSAAAKFARRAASGIDIQGIVQGKIDRLDLEELENLVLEVSGENLAAIELFGAILGGLAGVVLIDVRFMPLLPAMVFVFLIVEKTLTRLSRKGSGAGHDRPRTVP
ncbi:MAG: DUF445 family protein [Candidatus Fermentibacteraceae bacterium]